ncbi:MAG: CBS domain-containing protein [Deltaproteobacteria bacterium]|nr:CBS domain-containing protein [Deltaproteobacteria bacterium]
MELITTHLHADFDALAAMIAAHKLYPEAVLAFPGSQEKNVRDFLSQGRQYDFWRLKNIPIDQITRLIVVDTRQRNRIGKFAECLDNPNLEIHLFDHHPDAPGDISGDYEVVRDAGSTTTILVDIFQQRNTEISADEASLLLLAIHEDTGSFTFDSTTPGDLSAAAWLMHQGAQVNIISQFIAQDLSAYELGLLNEMVNGAATYTIQGVDLVIAKLSVKDYVDEFARLVRKFMVMENLNAIFALARMGDRIYLIARSRIPEVNVGNIAQEFGGGGHASAASATIKGMTLVEVEEKLVQALHKCVLPASRALDLMSAPVISAGPDVSIDQVHEILTRYSITVLPIVEGDKQPAGLISRRVVEKAIFHGLGGLPASDYMTTDFAVLPPSATLADIQEVIIGHRQRFIPVLENGRMLGVITRTDLLNILIKDPSHSPASFHRDGQPSIERNRNLQNQLFAELSSRMMELLRIIGEVAQKYNYTAYAVGGFVRDVLLHIRNLDLDIVIEGDGIDFAKQLAKRLQGKVRAHKKFNTALVKLADGFKVDVATARLEYYEYPAAMPIVELSSIKLDLFRRDFTINAMAIHLNPDKFGLLVDFFNCQNDLRDRQIRVLHNLSFVEDPTRIFRAIRFEQRMGFSLGKLTSKLLKNAVKMNMYDRFTGGRFFHELKMILAEENPQPAIYRLQQFGLLKFLHPALVLDQRLKNILMETHRCLAWYKRLYLDTPCRQWQVFLLALTARLNGSQVKEFLQKFEVLERDQHIITRNKTAVIKALNALRSCAMPTGTDLAGKFGRPNPGERNTKIEPTYTLPLPASKIYSLLHGLSIEGLIYLMGAASKSCHQLVSLYVTKLRGITTVLDGNDLLHMGYEAGPQFAVILQKLLEARLDGLVEGRAAEETFVKNNFKSGTTTIVCEGR